LNLFRKIKGYYHHGNMIRKNPWILLMTNILLVPPLLCISNPSDKAIPLKDVNTLLYEFKQASNDSIKISRLSEIALYYNDYANDGMTADSFSDEGIRIAEKSRQSHLQLHAYNCYVESHNFSSKEYSGKSLNYANKAKLLCEFCNYPRIEWRTLHNLSIANFINNIYSKAREYSEKSMDIAKQLSDTVLLTYSYLDFAKGLEGENRKKEALSNFLSAVKLAERCEKRSLQIKCYDELSRFFYQNKLYERSIYYKNIQKKLTDPADTVALMWIQHDMLLICWHFNPEEYKISDYLKVVDFAITKKNNKLKENELANLRSMLIETDQFEELYHVYHDLYPEEMDVFRRTDTAQYFKLKAFFKIVEHQNDSSEYFFKKAEKFIVNNGNHLIISTFYNRYGEFLKRCNKKHEAIKMFELSLDYANKSTFFVKKDYMLTASMQLDSLYSDIGDFKKAYYFSKLTKELSDSINILATKEEVITVSLNYEAMQKEFAYQQSMELEKQKAESVMRQRRTERMMMGGGILFLIIITYSIYRNYRTQKRSNLLLDAAKKKSDDLLLNILPFETAEELKQTGEAKAKKFDEVSVMFTDFKDFTVVSEKMGAEELVKLIHFYFTEFDRIISSHGIEKIKIIGDSYMCVGGLPVSNDTHAYDVVSAAIELQHFMEKQKIERSVRNEPFFELRIGIHTGPVVAGIVGMKKFAYDVWGDTVNTASRMENTGETNKVNISGSTYERVKERFNCSYRGKIKAKNKGEIDMYFVLPPDQE
jgi:class 3 adenylate cyclase